MLIKKSSFIKYLVLIVVITIFIIIDYHISLGIILGYLFSILNYLLIKFRYTYLSLNKPIVMLGSFVGIIILAIPLLISVLVPSIFSWIGTTIGLLYEKYYLLFTGILRK